MIAIFNHVFFFKWYFQEMSLQTINPMCSQCINHFHRTHYTLIMPSLSSLDKCAPNNTISTTYYKVQQRQHMFNKSSTECNKSMALFLVLLVGIECWHSWNFFFSLPSMILKSFFKSHKFLVDHAWYCQQLQNALHCTLQIKLKQMLNLPLVLEHHHK